MRASRLAIGVGVLVAVAVAVGMVVGVVALNAEGPAHPTRTASSDNTPSARSPDGDCALSFTQTPFRIEHSSVNPPSRARLRCGRTIGDMPVGGIIHMPRDHGGVS